MIDFTKPVQMRCGKPVRIICTDRKGEQPIIGLVKQFNDETEIIHFWCKDGSFYTTKEISSLDLVNAPQRHKHADLMIAYANDASLKFEFRPNVEEDWYPIDNPTWNSKYEYRIQFRQST